MNLLNTYINTLMNRLNGQFFSVTFTKKDGTLRKLNCRTGVTKYLKGGVRTTSPSDYLIVYSIKDKGYRNVSIKDIKEIISGGVVVYSLNSLMDD